MSKKSAKAAGPITRRQQVEALRLLKTHQVAESVAARIREAVKDEVERTLKPIKDTMLDLIDRVVDLESVIYEGDSRDRFEGEEAPSVPEHNEVVPEQVGDGLDLSSPNPKRNDAMRRLHAKGL